MSLMTGRRRSHPRQTMMIVETPRRGNKYIAPSFGQQDRNRSYSETEFF